MVPSDREAVRDAFHKSAAVFKIAEKSDKDPLNQKIAHRRV